MARYTFITDAGIRLPEIKQKGAHTASKSRTEEEKEEKMPNTSASERLEQQANEIGLPVKGLNIQVENETVHLKGTVKNQELKEKLILLVGNVQGISEVVEEVGVQTEGQEAHFHTVTSEDNLKRIAEKYMEDPERYKMIIEANKPFIAGENDLYPGMVIRIPYLKSE